jgi:F-type H+-transporting ATPase subunit alpha
MRAPADVPVEKVAEFERGLYQYMDANHPQISKTIMDSFELSAENEQALEGAVRSYKSTAGF